MTTAEAKNLAGLIALVIEREKAAGLPGCGAIIDTGGAFLGALEHRIASFEVHARLAESSELYAQKPDFVIE